MKHNTRVKELKEFFLLKQIISMDQVAIAPRVFGAHNSAEMLMHARKS